MFVLARRYEIIQRLGDGGNFGITFLARDILQPSKPLCVVKQLRPNHTDPRVIKFFEEEAITLEKLGKHSHIPQYKFLHNQIITRDNHQVKALAVAREDIDVATNNNEALARLEKSHEKEHKNIKEIWRSLSIPTGPIVYRKDLAPDLKDKIQTFFYNYEDKKVLNALGWSKFHKANDSIWQDIRNLDDIEKEMEKVKSNSVLTEDERQQELAEIQTRLKEICKKSSHSVGNKSND